MIDWKIGYRAGPNKTMVQVEEALVSREQWMQLELLSELEQRVREYKDIKPGAEQRMYQTLAKLDILRCDKCRVKEKHVHAV